MTTEEAPKLLSIHQAAAQGIERIRRSNWSHPMDHLKLDLVEGGVGPWVHLCSPFNMPINGRDPFDILVLDVDNLDVECWEVYEGAVQGSPEYQAEVDRVTAGWESQSAGQA